MNQAKKIVLVIAPKNFRDEEYFVPKEALKKAGFALKTASTLKGEIKGAYGKTAESQMTIDEIDEKNFDAIVFVGGGGASVYFENPHAWNLAKSFYNNDKLVCAICIAPVILANAGLLKGKTATSYIDGKDAIIKGGAVWTGKDVEADGRIITANGPLAADGFASEIIKFFNGGK
jgi:protease I